MNIAIMILMLIIIFISYPFLPDRLIYVYERSNGKSNKIFLFVMPAAVGVTTIVVFLLFLLPALLDDCFPLRKKNNNVDKKNLWDEEAQMYKNEKIDMDNSKDQKTNTNNLKDGVIAITNGVGAVTKGFTYSVVTFVNVVVSIVNVALLLGLIFVVLQIDL